MSKQRFVLIPGENRFNRDQPPRAGALMARSASRVSGGARSSNGLNTVRGANGTKLRVMAQIDTELGVDALLLELSDKERAAIRKRYPDLRVVPEGRAEMAFARLTLQPVSLATMAGTTLSTATLTVRALTPSGEPIKDALVQMVLDEHTDPPTGAEAVTNAKGVAKLPVPKVVKRSSYLRVEPQHSHWPAMVAKPTWTRDKTFELTCMPITQGFADVLSEFGGAGDERSGKGVVVAIIDGGAGPHPALPAFTGVNLTVPGSPSSNLVDNGIGHGTHVAGIIAGQGGGRGITGMAPGVTLKVYRVYGRNESSVNAFSVAAAIRQAIADGADLINLSLTLPKDDLSVVRQVQAARAAGRVCIAAAGNMGGDVMMPARHDAVVAVSALGCRGRWPTGASFTTAMRKTPKGRNPKHFVAAFSCIGAEIDFAGPGVGVVSLFPKSRLAVMNGTSMAAPAITGLMARLLAARKDILRAPKNQARSDAIVALALAAARNLGFPSRFQGRGTLG